MQSVNLWNSAANISKRKDFENFKFLKKFKRPKT